MSNERNRLEQEALQAINRGNYDDAIRSYLHILKQDPKDRRIRQRLGELNMKVGKTMEAERHLREVADALVKEQQYRAAVALFKMLVQLRPDDPPIQMELADCYLGAGYPNDARAYFDAAMRGFIAGSKHLQAAAAARKIADLSPGEPALRLKVAELLENGSDNAAAAKVYDEVIEEYRRRGRPDEVGRVAELALRGRPDDLGLLLDAAAAKVEAQDFKRALTHLQPAFQAAPREPRVLDLLAKAFEGTGQAEKALKVLGELARIATERHDPPTEADALRRAAKLAPTDAELAQRLAAAEARVTRLERRLTSLVLSQPTTEDELRAAVRAEVYARYGLADRADNTLRAALEARKDSVPLRAALAEVLVVLGRVDEARAVMESLVPLAGAEAPAVLDRLAVLRGGALEAPKPASAPEPRAAAPVAGAPAPAAPPVAPAAETPRQRGDRLAAHGDLEGAMMAYRQALQADPTDDDVLAKIGELRQLSRSAPPPPPPAEPDDGTFAEVSPDALDELPLGDPLEEARANVAVGMYDDALALVADLTGLPPRVVEAQAVRGKGDVAGAVTILQTATNDAAESDPGYIDALFELSGLYTMTGKQRAALRLLEELRDLDPGYRSGEVDARVRGLQKLLK